MKSIKTLLNYLSIIAILVISGCVDKTPLSDENKIFAGTWVANDDTWIQIYNDGGGDFELGNSSVSGGAAIITDSTLNIKLFGIDEIFSIDRAPYKEDGELKMELDGNVYIKE